LHQKNKKERKKILFQIVAMLVATDSPFFFNKTLETRTIME